MQTTTPTGVSPAGRNIVIAYAYEKTQREDVKACATCCRLLYKELASMGFKTRRMKVSDRNLTRPHELRKRLSRDNPLCIFNLFEGFSYNTKTESVFSRILESAKIPFTGNSTSALELCLDKQAVKERLALHGVKVPAGVLAKSPEDVENAGLRLPAFIKPCYEDASVGIGKDSLVSTREELLATVRNRLAAFPSGVIAEEFIPGVEYTVGLIGTPPYEVIGISSLQYNPAAGNELRFLHYESKWDTESESFRMLMPQVRPLPPEIKAELEDIAIRAGKAVGCNGYFRVDVRERNGEYYVLDINPNPDINSDSGFIKQARKSGYTYGQVLTKIIAAATC
ncbi:MAG: ATP-grasp domain-containing protein [Elusimicrobiaceae bacterium]|nr:ATP-grasp domain-containing protein [Elusimicrobiaceae bacterium]